ncbi:MAG: ferrous iron transport protein A [Endomicrobia bacterium]|nr:ferrous iron transport protein A [Endomicrobiia bacterium]
MKKDITQIKQNKKYKVVEITAILGMKKKLDALGIRIGAEITILSSLSHKGPKIIQIGNTQIAIGQGIAKKIIVEEIE